ncbi:MAG: MarR family winged helix-turn-helix transcriptional regulator [Candidatus Fimadaptatus sp.]|jgi:DNA-binding MarR family transcriptional regulator
MNNDTVRELCRLLAASYGLYNEKIARRFKSAHTDMLPGVQYMLLRMIADADHLTAGELAARAMMQKQQVTHALNQLEGRDLIRRVRRAEDRRVVWLEATDGARALLSEIHDELEAQLIHAFSDVDGELIARYTEAMHTIMDILERMPSPGDGTPARGEQSGPARPAEDAANV